MSGTGRLAFSLTDLSVALALAALLGSTAVLVSARSRDPANRIKCASNLRQIGLGMQMYASVHRGAVFPRTVYDGVGGAPTEYTGVTAASPFAPGGPSPNDVTAALFLVLRTQDLTPEVFNCPSAGWVRPWDYGGRSRETVSNFPSRGFLSYAYQNVYPTKAAIDAGFKVNFTLSSDFAIAADMGPGDPATLTTLANASRTQMAMVNSPNHNGDGQNVLYADGHVEFTNSPYAGSPRPVLNTPRDNVYTFGAATLASAGDGIRGSPLDRYDSVLLPTFADGPAPTLPPIEKTVRVLSVAVGVVALGAIVAGAMLAIRRRRARRLAEEMAFGGPMARD